jgi:hypothetical protein
VSYRSYRYSSNSHFTSPQHQGHLLPNASIILFRDYAPGTQQGPYLSALVPVAGETDSLPDDNDCVRIGDFRIPSQYFNPWEIIQPNSHSELTIFHKHLQRRSFILRSAVGKVLFLLLKHLDQIIRGIGRIDKVRFNGPLNPTNNLSEGSYR